MAMKVFIPTKNREATISTHKVFDDSSFFEYFVVVHNQEQWQKYAENSEKTGIDSNRIVVSNVLADQYGLTRQREWVINNLAEKDSWFLFADDNIKGIQAVPQPNYSFSALPVQENPYLRSEFETPCSQQRFSEEIIPECIQYAEKYNAHHVGFSTVDNFYFRESHWKRVGYIIGKMMLWKNKGELQFDHNITMEDFELTAQSLLKYGVSLVNQWVFPVAGHYQPGGMGKKEERFEVRKKDIQILMEKYPNLFVEKKGDYPDLKLRIHSKEQIASWQKQMKLTQKSLKGIFK